MTRFVWFRVCYLLFVLCAVAGVMDIIAVRWLLPLMILSGAGLLSALAVGLQDSAATPELNQ